MAAAVVLASCVTAPVYALPYVFDSHRTVVTFTYSMGFISGGGKFSGVAGKVNFDPAAPERARVEAHIDTRTLTAEPIIDDELRGPGFFDVAAHPKMHFKSRSVHALKSGHLQMSGMLTIRGISRPIVLQVNIERQANGLAFSAATRIRRSHFNMSGYSGLVSDTVDIQIKGPLRSAR